MATDKIQTGLRLQRSVLEKITAIAKREHRSLNAQMEHAVQKYIDEYEAIQGAVPVHSEEE